jgi:AcrR family transcriptional regulator
VTDAVVSPPANRRARKRRQLTDQVAAIAFGLFEERGYEAVTMEQVAAAADISKGTLYKYFPVKEALLAHQFQQEIASGMTPLWPLLEQQGSFAAQMSYLLQASAQWNEARRIYIPHYVRHEFRTANFSRDDLRQHRPSGARQILERLCLAGQQRGDVRSDLTAAQLAVMLECLCLGAILNWLARPEATLQQEFDAMLLLALTGMGPRSDAAVHAPEDCRVPGADGGRHR